ncbi:PIG8 [Auxenochlorella protothecoides x Auxenochlorella symbiontica]
MPWGRSADLAAFKRQASCQLHAGLAGLRDAASFHRCIAYFVYDHRILTKTIQCTVLNGVVFLGSVLLVRHGLRPLLATTLSALLGQGPGSAATSLLMGAYGALWVLPAHVVSLLINTLWYAELAELTIAAGQRQALVRRAERLGEGLSTRRSPIKARIPDPMTLISESVYRILLLCAISLQTFVLDLLPVVGRATSVALMAWLYALYSFDYKWAAHGVPLITRVSFFETHWAYFAGFGLLPILPVLLTSFFIGSAVVGVAFPLFIILAADANPKARQAEVQQAHGPAQLSPLRVFAPASWMTNAALRSVGGGMRAATRMLRRRWTPRRAEHGESRRPAPTREPAG